MHKCFDKHLSGLQCADKAHGIAILTLFTIQDQLVLYASNLMLLNDFGDAYAWATVSS
jgi:hypothetical protein